MFHVLMLECFIKYGHDVRNVLYVIEVHIRFRIGTLDYIVTHFRGRCFFYVIVFMHADVILKKKTLEFLDKIYSLYRLLFLY